MRFFSDSNHNDIKYLEFIMKFLIIFKIWHKLC